MKRNALILIVAVLTVVLAALVVGCGDSSTDGSGTVSGDQPRGPGDPTAMLGAALDPLVEAGTITAEQEEAVLGAIAANRPQRPEGGAPPDAADGQRPAPGEMFSSALDGLVSDGTLDEAQSEAVSEALTAAMPQRGMAVPGGAEDDATPAT